MEIGTSLNLPTLGGTQAGRIITVNGQPVSLPSSPFGPASVVTISSDIPAFQGFRDYTQLSGSLVWQFDLSGVLNPTGVGLPETARSPEQRELEEKAVERAFEYIDAGEYDAARQLMNVLLKDNPTNAAAVHALGYAELSDGNYELAEKLFLKAHAFNPTVGYDRDAGNARLLQQDDNTVISRARAMIANPIQRGEGTRVLIVLTRRRPEWAAAHLLLGDALLAQGDGNNGLMQYSAAITHADATELKQMEQRLEKLVQAAPRAAFVRQLLGRVQSRQGRYDQAIQTLSTAVQLADGDVAFQRELARAYVARGRQQLARGDISAGLADLFKAKELDYTGYETKQAVGEGYVARAQQRVQQGDLAAAATDFQLAAQILSVGGNKELRQRAAAAAYALGRTLERKRLAAGGEVDSEVVAYQAAYDLDPKNKMVARKLADTRVAIGDQLYAQGKYLEAAQSYRRAHLLFEHDETYKEKAVDAYVTYADWRLYNYNFDDAVSAYLDAYRIDASNTATREKLADAYYRRGLNYQEEQDYKKAVADFKSALRLFPSNATYQAAYNALRGWDQ